MKRQSLARNMRILFILLWLYTALEKLVHAEQFRSELAQSPYAAPYSDSLSWLVPGLEITTAILLVIPACRMIGLYASFILMAIFTSYLFLLARNDHYIPCSCGGFLETLPQEVHILMDAGLSILALAGLWASKRRHRLIT